MPSISERFLNRKNRAMEFVIKYPSAEKPEYEFTVKRMPEAVDTNASNRAVGSLKDRGVELTGPAAPEDVGWQFYVWKGYHLVEQGIIHFTGWKPLDGSEVPSFSRAAFTDWLGVLSAEEKQLLGMAYMRAVAEADAEKKEPSENTGQAS